jgi:hypothetical protein
MQYEVVVNGSLLAIHESTRDLTGAGSSEQSVP